MPVNRLYRVMPAVIAKELGRALFYQLFEDFVLTIAHAAILLLFVPKNARAKICCNRTISLEVQISTA